MQQSASGLVGSVGLGGAEPPLSPEVLLSRSPSFPRAIPAAPAADARRRLVLRLLGGEEIELADFERREDAMAAAAELVSQLAAAEASGEWPEVDGRFLRPGSIASLDVVPAA